MDFYTKHKVTEINVYGYGKAFSIEFGTHSEDGYQREYVASPVFNESDVNMLIKAWHENYHLFNLIADCEVKND